MTARLLDGWCQRYGQLPSAVLAEDAATLMRLRRVLYWAEDDAPELPDEEV